MHGQLVQLPSSFQRALIVRTACEVPAIYNSTLLSRKFLPID